MTRAVVCVATSSHYQKGAKRLASAKLAATSNVWMEIPSGSPSHENVPYAFKAVALKQVASEGADLLLWCDASILPIRSLEPLWERIERDGYWIARNGWSNYQWTADSAYPDLFAGLKEEHRTSNVDWFVHARAINKRIPHVVATSFGLNVRHPIGRAFLDEYYRLASETKAFCGPWINAKSEQANEVQQFSNTAFSAPCGPADVLGHRHDQTAASVIAWRLGMKLTDCPEIFAYSKRRPDGTLHLEDQDERTILLADGKLEDGNVL